MKNLKGHQGDVIFSSIEKLPAEAVEVKNSPIALGETHGHCHVLTGKNVKRYEYDKRIFFVVLHTSILQHTNIANMQSEESYTATEVLPVCDHNPHFLPAGIYEFWIQNQYNPYKKLMEKVID